MPDHVAVGEVDDDEIVLAGGERGDHRVGDLGRAHFRLEVVGRDLRRVDQDPVLVQVRRFAAAVEEKGHVGVFLGLGAVQLAQPGVGDDAAERHLRAHRAVGDRRVQAAIVVGHRRDRDRPEIDAALEMLEMLVHQRGTDLAHAVVAEIEADHFVARRDRHQARQPRRQDEFVALAGGIALLDRGRRRPGVDAAPVDDAIEGELDPVPALVAVHRVVTPHDAADVPAAVGEQRFEFGQVGNGRLRRGIAAVGQHVYLRHDLVLRAQPDQREQVIDMAVHAAVRHQAEQVQRPPGGFGVLDRARQRRILEKAAIGDRVVDAHEVLLDDRAAADGHVADLGIAHLPGGQADAAPRGLERGQRIALEVAVEIGRLGLQDGVMRRIRIDSETVENNQ